MQKSQSNPTESPEVEATVNALIAAEMRALERNVPFAIATELAADPAKLFAIRTMKWWTRKFDTRELLIGDRPLISTPAAKWPCGIAINDPNCIVALAISPSTVFFAAANPKTRTNM